MVITGKTDSEPAIDIARGRHSVAAHKTADKAVYILRANTPHPGATVRFQSDSVLWSAECSDPIRGNQVVPINEVASSQSQEPAQNSFDARFLPPFRRLRCLLAVVLQARPVQPLETHHSFGRRAL